MDLRPYTKLRLSLQLIPCQVVTLLETLHGAQKPQDVQVEDRLCFVVVSDGRGVSLKDQDVIQPQNRGVEKVRLEGQSVPIATGEAEDRLRPSGLQQGTNGEGTQPHDRILEVWDMKFIVVAGLQPTKGHPHVRPP